ncbi:MAG: hypothetical protein ACI8W3_002755 [Myxococcota bacterium]|jgi:hypothetical protein
MGLHCFGYFNFIGIDFSCSISICFDGPNQAYVEAVLFRTALALLPP